MEPINNINLVDLQCPILCELFVDPITVPCCGKAFERSSLILCFQERGSICPTCRSDLTNFNPETIAKNVVITSLIELIKQGQKDDKDTRCDNEHQWVVKATPITPTSDMCELDIIVFNSKFTAKQSLFICVVDCSGSMSSNADQVRAALRYIIDLSKQGVTGNMKLVILSYNHTCKEIHSASEYIISGGTSFPSAFNEIVNVLTRYKDYHDTASIAFMTDGQAGGGRNTLAETFKRDLHTVWGECGKDYVVHVVGFSSSCDKELLEQISKVGTKNGVFRYAEPGDDDDTLCGKLTSIYDYCSNSSTVPITINGNEEIKLSIDMRKQGSYRKWHKIHDLQELTISSSEDNDIVVPIEFQLPNKYVLERWINNVIDNLGSELLDNIIPESNKLFKDLRIALFEQKLLKLSSNYNDYCEDRINYLKEQIKDVKAGNALNIGKLKDFRYGGLFNDSVKPTKPKAKVTRDINTYQQPTTKHLDDKPYHEPPLVRYNRNNGCVNDRNKIQQEICDTVFDCEDKISPQLKEDINNASLDELQHVDEHGNNALMLAAYCGHSNIVSWILKKYNEPSFVNKVNNNDESALTLAIKKNGYYRTINLLLVDGNASVPEKRVKSLERYAIENNFTETASLLNSIGLHKKSTDVVDDTMKESYIMYVYERNKSSLKNAEQFLNVALSKKMLDLAKTLINEHAVVPTLEMVVKHCFPPKPDHPDTESVYIPLIKLVINANPSLIEQQTDPEKNSLLHVAVDKGSLPHVKYLISKGSNIECGNYKLNTPLWVASFKQYPCIIDYLIEQGANLDAHNEKGYSLLYGPCTRGSCKVLHQLLSYGVPADDINVNGDTLPLIACRNGHKEVLEILLQYVDQEFMNFRAKIDGFNAVMACAEQDHPECLRVLSEFGMDINCKTSDDNSILPGATPLHIASYYNRSNVLKMLIQLGANINETDIYGQTPLHIAVMQGNVGIVELLLKRRQLLNLNAKDKLGNTPLHYIRGNEYILQLLISPVLDVLIKLSKGNIFSKDEESKICEILKEYASIPELLSTSDVINVTDINGTTPLMISAIYNNINVFESLMKLGADPTIENQYSMSTINWIKWKKNPRMLKTVKHWMTDDNQDKPVIKLATDKQMLFLGMPNKTISTYHDKSTLSVRMEEIDGVMRPQTQCAIKFGDSTDSSKNEIRNNEINELFDECQLWNSRIFTINKLAEMETNLTPKQIYMLSLSTDSGKFLNKMNNYINLELTSTNPNLLTDPFTNVIKFYYNTLKQLQSLKDREVYIGSESANRKLFTPRTVFTLNNFVSGSTIWKIAVDNVPSFTSNSKKGIIFILKSKTGKLINMYSRHFSESEVIFLPDTKFEVKKWYHGNVIALGQENIREHSFGVKDYDQERLPYNALLNSDKSLIIEMHELD